MEREMKNDFLHGSLVRLCAVNSATDAEAFSQWSRDSEYMRLSDAGVVQMWTIKQTAQFIEKELEGESMSMFAFSIHTLDNHRLVGEIDLSGINWLSGEAIVGIGIGDRNDWGKGYGTDAMQVVLRFAFRELNLHRVFLNTFEYNPRAIRSYAKCGFKHEGHQRGALNREGRRWDLIFMGILKEEWEKMTEDERPMTE
jgi:RimJ/RimL family protein N-acetyltransferase